MLFSTSWENLPQSTLLFHLGFLLDGRCSDTVVLTVMCTGKWSESILFACVFHSHFGAHLGSTRVTSGVLGLPLAGSILVGEPSFRIERLDSVAQDRISSPLSSPRICSSQSSLWPLKSPAMTPLVDTMSSLISVGKPTLPSGETYRLVTRSS